MRFRSAALSLLLLVAACGSQTPVTVPPAPEPTAGVPGFACPDKLAGGRGVSFGAKKNLAGLVLGTGKTGIVLLHELDTSLCRWLASAKEWADQGYRVLAFDGNGYGSSPFTGDLLTADLAAAAAFLRQDGVTDIVLMGASMGGTAVIQAAAEITPPVAGVVSVSGPLAFSGMNAALAAATLTVPVLYISAKFDERFTDAAERMYADSTKSKDARILIIDGSGHGTPLISPEGGYEDARAAVADFLKTHAKVS